ncbi:MAG TPA: hypothetical protein VK797_17475, partial [Tepidisphaeraceae bacterium]|nr:hypothetical protein [Tepidisphaeraceae bacterium]
MAKQHPTPGHSAAEAERRPGFSLRRLPVDAERDLTADGADRADGIQAALAAEAKARTRPHLPRIGCGLVGGRWDLTEPIIERTLCKNGIEV